ncbi:hypothetical protein O1R50_24385 [Glycomyces luteolus]|uniref:Uncharacterized protein n=1 Tax=Glycomyces luteolus TaxID=2670330 RepID=A0A9X3PHQ5_9ACTN|nr:hypothetical protein [Glycomyces luteolus]MDA1362779.1 hypothetical protein [Glycomyces luteolus]
MSGRGNDQEGRWPVGIWFAMVGVSAGTVASFSLIGWTFARDLYGGEDGTEPLHYEPQTVVIEAEETPGPEGIAGGDEGPAGGPADPGPEPQIAVSPAEPQAERIAEAGGADPRLELEDEPVLVQSKPPQLVPVEEDEGDCGPEESAAEPGWEHDWDGGWDPEDDGGQGSDDLEPYELDLDLASDQDSIELGLELESEG